MAISTTDALRNPAAMQARVHQRFALLRRHVRARLALEGLAWTAAALLALMLLSLPLDWLLNFSPATRTGLTLAALLGAGVLAWCKVVCPLRRPLSPFDLAAQIDRAHNDDDEDVDQLMPVAEHVARVLHLPGPLNDDPDTPLPGLLGVVVRQSFLEIEHTDLHEHLDDRPLLLSIGVAGSLALIAMLILLTMPTTTGIWVKRWTTDQPAIWSQPVLMQVTRLRDGQLPIPRGQPATITVIMTSTAAAPPPVQIQINHADGQKLTAAFTHSHLNVYYCELAPLHESATAWVRCGDATVGPFTLVPTLDAPGTPRE